MGEGFDKVKDVTNKILKKFSKKFLIIGLIIIVLMTIFAGSVYVITIDDGTYKEDDWSNTPYAAAQYTTSINVQNGAIQSAMTAQELWDKMMENDSRVNLYLDTPEELLKLMNAELVTQFLDTRENPDEPIDWETINKDVNAKDVQGISKLKRQDSDGNTYTMTYVDEDTFQSYINEYNQTGSEEARKNALKYFTLGSTSGTGSGTNKVIDGVNLQVLRDGDGIVTTYNGDGSAIEGGSLDRFGDPLSDGKVACKLGYIKDHSVIYIETSETGEGSHANGKFYYVCDCGGGLVDGQIDVYVNAAQSTINAAPYGRTNNATISLVEEDVSWEDYLSKYHDATLSSISTSDSASNSEIEEDSNGQLVVEDSQKIVDAAKSTPSAGAGYCLRWVSNVYQAAGLKACTGACARESAEQFMISNSKDNIPIGAAVYGTGSGRGNYGHIGIYIGNNMVMDCISDSEITTSTLDDWIAWQERKAGITINGNHVKGYLGWGWPDGVNRTPSLGSINNSSASGKSKFYAKVATWKEVENKVETNDPDIEAYDNFTYTMTTTNINYQDLLKPFTMPFNYLWEFLCTGEEKEFVLELADLVYNSEINITVLDNLTITTNVDTHKYTKKVKTETQASASLTYVNTSTGANGSDSNSGNYTDEETYDYTTVYTTVTKNNIINVAVTLADIWMAKYEQKYTCEVPEDTVTTTDNVFEDIEYSEIEGSPNNNDSYGHATSLLNGLRQSHSGCTFSNESKQATEHIYNAVVNRSQNIVNTVHDIKYVSSPLTVEEKTDSESEEPNFVTLFLKHGEARNKILSIESWLFELIETNDDTKELLDLTKYLMYKAVNIDYGVTEYDFGALWKKVYQAMTNVAGGDIIVNTDMADEKTVITDEDILEDAINKLYSGQARNNLLSVLNNGTFMKLQEEYRVNAVFAIAVTKIESSVGTAWSAIPSYTHNWMSMTGSYKGQSVASNGSNPRHWRVYPSFDEATLDFGDQIANGSYYFQAGKYTVKQIAPTYCNAAWGEAVVAEMVKIYDAAGITINENAFYNSGGMSAKEGWSTKGRSCPRYYQSDSRWGSKPYNYGPGKTIARGGCGACALAMGVSGLLEQDITPDIIVEYLNSININTVYNGAGSAKAVADKYGLTYELISRSNKIALDAALDAGKVCIFSIDANGIYTGGGHFIMCNGRDAAGYYVLESGRFYETDRPYTFNQVFSPGVQGVFVLGK